MTANHLHFDCYSGISGDMILGALVDLGLSVEKLREGLADLPIGPFALVAERVKRQGIMGTRLRVEIEGDDHSGGWHEHAQSHQHHHEHGHGTQHSHEHHHAHEHHHGHEHGHHHEPEHEEAHHHVHKEGH